MITLPYSKPPHCRETFTRDTSSDGAAKEEGSLDARSQLSRARLIVNAKKAKQMQKCCNKDE